MIIVEFDVDILYKLTPHNYFNANQFFSIICSDSIQCYNRLKTIVGPCMQSSNESVNLFFR